MTKDTAPTTPPNQLTRIPEDNTTQSVRRESSRLRTPVVRAGYVQPQNDYRRSLVAKGTSKQTQILDQTVTQVSKRTGQAVDIDLAQDSDEENEKVTKKTTRKPKDGYDHPRSFFYLPGTGPKQAPDAMTWACRWCPNAYLAQANSNYNLKIHWDGSNNKGTIRSACPGRAKAIEAGCKLPPTALELVKEAAKNQTETAGNLNAYTSKGCYNNDTMNKLIVIWVVRHSLPWIRIEDYLLRESESKISIGSDVWTTKGSHKAFIGISCCYINKNWTFVSQHLAINNNFTMAKEVASIFLSADFTQWDVEQNHHRCICHVIALILGAGLKALKLSRKILQPEKTDQHFPNNNRRKGELFMDNDVDDATSGIGLTLKKIDYICRQIASSPQKQAEWKLWASKLGYNGREVISGYGIRWNIAYESRQRAWEGRRVFDARSDKLKANQPPTTPPTQVQTTDNSSSDSDSDGNKFNYYPINSQATEENTELERYSTGNLPLDKKGKPLDWWKIHCKDFPVLGSLAQDYLACSASSATVELTFSAAANVCGSERSSLGIRTIERCISSHLWLRNGVEMAEEFSDCEAIIRAAEKSPKFTKQKK
ncbi:hypothetical protein PGTUg99_002028 [Puccinia graminis f. sp. tritici]|uniref:HAT C-terminal dimerisation domain-containing protein n=1 Tax=Puccinia graminis f. sp. tritici TaxID=56615 RepID=A0A5B0QDI2_PUCGR|nr:hypothetical protein PGTUg99_002028 [Puccinia graminis f. sp. tritici]